MNSRLLNIMLALSLPFGFWLGMYGIPACGRQPPPKSPSCTRTHDGCITYAAQSGDILSYYSEVWDCEWDYGTCLGVRTTSISCSAGCLNSYSETTCETACDSARGIP